MQGEEPRKMKNSDTIKRHVKPFLLIIQGENDTFVVEFDQCPAFRKPHLQEVALFDMIAYKDAIRHHVCIGDKVLAPWQNDGRYGPGTVLDGVDRRDLQPQGTYFCG